MGVLINSLIISLFCVGLRIVTGEGMILHFLRMPYEELVKIKNPRKSGVVLIYLLKPIIGCVTCMSSVYSLLISHFYFNGIDKWTFIVIFVSACLNSVIHAAYERLNTCKL